MENTVEVYDEIHNVLSIQKFSEQFKVDFDDNVTEFLGFLVHDKSHVMDNKSRVKEMETALKAAKNYSYRGSVFRGTYGNYKDTQAGEVITFGRYESFSGNFDWAKLVAKKTKFLLEIENPRGCFPYSEWLKYLFLQLKKENPSVFNAVDGDYMIETANKEQELIFGIGTKLDVKSIYTDGPYIIAKCVQI